MLPLLRFQPFLGGAKSHEDISNLIKETGTVAWCWEYFVFKGKYRAVLINYPSVEQKFLRLMIISMNYEKLLQNLKNGEISIVEAPDPLRLETLN